MSTRDGEGLSRARKLTTFLAMAGAGGIVARHAVSRERLDWFTVAFAGMLALAGLGMTRRSLVSQVLSRAVGWLVFLPCLLGTTLAVLDGRPGRLPISVPLLLALTGTALALTWPMLYTADAKRQFGPRVLRHWFLAGATTMAATGIVSGAIALDSRHAPGLALGLGAYSLSLLASAIGVVKMRSWGVFLGGLTSFVLLAVAPFVGAIEAFMLVLAAVPSLLLQVLPVLVARASGSGSHETSGENVRVAMANDAFVDAERIRVADSVDGVAELETSADASEPLRAAIPLRSPAA